MQISSWARRTGWLSLIGLFANLGCFGSQGRGYQLYAGPPADPSAVAKLTGHIMAIDGKNVLKLGRNFELMPGCHLVTTRRTWGGVGDNGGVVADIGAQTYAIRMLAGHSYLIEVKPEGTTGSASFVRVSAKERDATGKVTGSFSPAPDDPTCENEHRDGKDVVVPVPRLGS